MRDSPLTWADTERPQRYFLIPDRMEHISHNVPDGYNIRAVTARGEAVFGRIVDSDAPWMELTLDPAWVLKLPPSESELNAARAKYPPKKDYVAVWEEWLAMNAMKLDA